VTGAYTRTVSGWQWLLLSLGAVVVIYAGFVLALVLAGRRTDARAVGGFIPDSIVLFKRLLTDPRLPVSRKIVLGGIIVYLACPLDLIPDFIPVAGVLDDVIIVAFGLRLVLRGADRRILCEHWPGPDRSLQVISRAAFGRSEALR
jgi:uncharacterized membrane protein YkvA (DUF1232 family)